MSIFSNLTAEQFETIGQELDAIRNREMADLGEKDANYIRTLIKRQRRLEVAGRQGPKPCDDASGKGRHGPQG